jgi:hypothetical protein
VCATNSLREARARWRAFDLVSFDSASSASIVVGRRATAAAGGADGGGGGGGARRDPLFEMTFAKRLERLKELFPEASRAKERKNERKCLLFCDPVLFRCSLSSRPPYGRRHVGRGRPQAHSCIATRVAFARAVPPPPREADDADDAALASGDLARAARRSALVIARAAQRVLPSGRAINRLFRRVARAGGEGIVLTGARAALVPHNIELTRSNDRLKMKARERGGRGAAAVSRRWRCGLASLALRRPRGAVDQDSAGASLGRSTLFLEVAPPTSRRDDSTRHSRAC